MISKIQQYFVNGPEVILLPRLEWNYDEKPDFNEEGFFIDYEMINSAHPPLRDRMFYGLHKMSSAILSGISEKQEYTITCQTFEPMLKELYKITTEDIFITK